MSAPTVKPGDTVRVTVTKVLPFAVLVETATGMPGLVKHAGPRHGDVITVNVTAVDDAGQRFSGPCLPRSPESKTSRPASMGRPGRR